jgi:hypothetical protein
MSEYYDEEGMAEYPELPEDHWSKFSEEEIEKYPALKRARGMDLVEHGHERNVHASFALQGYQTELGIPVLAERQFRDVMENPETREGVMSEINEILDEGETPNTWADLYRPVLEKWQKRLEGLPSPSGKTDEELGYDLQYGTEEEAAAAVRELRAGSGAGGDSLYTEEQKREKDKQDALEEMAKGRVNKTVGRTGRVTRKGWS